MLKAVILIGGPQKGTRFRPLSLDIPKPLFPVAGMPLIEHHIEALSSLHPPPKQILLIGSYPMQQMQPFLDLMQQRYSNLTVKYLQEKTPLGTAGGIFHFRDQIRTAPDIDAFFVMNGDICADFPLNDLLDFHMKNKNNAVITVMASETTKPQSLQYGCMVTDETSGKVKHFVEKPTSYVSTLINCGVYICGLEVFNQMAAVSEEGSSTLRFEQDVLAPLAGEGQVFALKIQRWWSPLKTACAAIYANKQYLLLYRDVHPERLTEASQTKCIIIPDVMIDPSSQVHPSATLGPNVSIGPNVQIAAGVRIRDSIILEGALIDCHSLVVNSIIGRGCTVGRWARVEGAPVNPPSPQSPPLFDAQGRLRPSVTILGSCVHVPPETILLNSIVLPHKELSRSFKNEIIL